MARFGLTLSSEEHGPKKLVEVAVAAEAAGFDFVSISDHFHPWTTTQGHSPFVWSVLGALSEATESIDVVVGVTCPTMRTHPAIIAQAVATTSLLFEDRFTWGVGSGENLNEHILGDPWPPAISSYNVVRPIASTAAASRIVRSSRRSSSRSIPTEGGPRAQNATSATDSRLPPALHQEAHMKRHRLARCALRT